MNNTIYPDLQEFTAILPPNLADLQPVKTQNELMKDQVGKDDDERLRKNYARVKQRDYERKAYETLKDAIPTLPRSRRPARIEILRHACDYIIHVKKQIELLEREEHEEQVCTQKN